MEKEAEAFKSVCFVTRSDNQTYNKQLYDLKSSAYIGRDEYPVTITLAYDILVRELGEFNTNKLREQQFQRGGGGGCRGHGGRCFAFSQTGRGRGNGSRTNGTDNYDSDNMV